MKVILVAHPRSGSNSLVEILQAHPSIGDINNEPFSEGYASWHPDNVDFRGRLARESFEHLVSEALRDAGGMKVLSYQLDGPLLARLMRCADVRVVTLQRNNLLETAVSQLLAERTGLWKTWDATKPIAEYYNDVGVLDVEDVRGSMEWTRYELTRVDKAAEGMAALRLDYETLFCGTLDDRLKTVNALWRFLGLDPFVDDAIRHFLSPAVQQGGQATYGQLANRAEIEHALGTDETGHLATESL